VAGAFVAVDLIAWHHAIADVRAGLATVLDNAQVAVVPFIAWLVLGERPDRGMLPMLPLAIAGIVLVSGVVGRDACGHYPVAGALFGCITAMTYSCFILVLRAGSRGKATTEP
jgi:drug/metabolite transporter (DMT)-like permease